MKQTAAPNEESSKARPAITVEALGKVYRSGWLMGRKITALQNVSLDVGRGQIFGLLGPNGAGKTTFLKILLGIIRKTHGDAKLLGYPAGHLKGRARVGYLPEQLRMPRHLTGHTALEFYGKLNGLSRSRIREKRDDLLEFVGLAGRGQDRISKYSKGMLQRLGLAQALLPEPELLVLDEPTDGLDPGARAEIRKLMQNLRAQGTTIFLNSHLLQEVELVCDRVAILNQGQLRYCGSVREIGDFVRGQSEDRSLNLYLELLGEESTIRDALSPESEEDSPGPRIVRCESRPPRVVLTAEFREQSEVDAAIDRLRSQGISIVMLQPESTSLEDAFLKIVANPNEN